VLVFSVKQLHCKTSSQGLWIPGLRQEAHPGMTILFRRSDVIPIYRKQLDSSPNHRHNSRIPSHQKGRLAIVTKRGTGCGGRGSVVARKSAWANDGVAYGEVVWS
jgi:hypothetical protein